jgi:hypothetical protein
VKDEMIENNLHVLEIRIAELVSKCAEKIKKEKVIPICKKYDLSFHTGMGIFVFADYTGKHIYKNKDTKMLYGNDFWDLYEELNNCPRNMPMSIGAYMNSYEVKR